ncbi:MAG: MerR family transcriptional regulator [Myxococcales bacterium]|nr:MAG: MerR family transcriptional regulator [Myxococcales bacterium]
MSAASLPDKLFFRIGEVANIVGVKAHVLRYWEEEFAVLKPMKTRGSHRVYRRRDVELAVMIRKLLHEDGFTVPGARKRLREIVRQKEGQPEVQERQEAVRETNLRADLLAIREQLSLLLRHIDEVQEHPDRAPSAPTEQQLRRALVRAGTRSRSEHR